MKKKKVVMTIIGEAVAKHGFKIDEEVDSPIIWIFCRNKGSIKQMISVQDNRSRPGLILRFETTAWGSPTVDASRITPSDENPYRIETWPYEDEETFRKVLEKFVDIIEKYGFDKLEEMSVEDEIIPTNEMGEKLLSHHESLSRKFAEENNLCIDVTSKENVSKLFEVLTQKFNNTKDEPYDSVKDMLVEVAAFLGEQLIREVGGEWQKGIESRIVFLCGLNCYGRPCYWIFRATIESWKNQNIEFLKQGYLYMLDAKLPLEIEQMIELQERWTRITSNK